MNYLNKIESIKSLSNLDKILENLSNVDQEIYFIGGASRSIILNDFNNKDIDLVVPNLEDSSIEKLINEFDAKFFPSYRSISLKVNDYEFQINSFRKDIKSTGRQAKVAPAFTLEEDSRRRDFTFNSIYINLLGEAFDFYNGINDLKDSYLRFIFDPIDQIQKDYLRAIRYIRFLSLFKYTKLNPKDIDAIILLSKNILEFVKEKKISQELNKTNKMPFPENTRGFLKEHKELNIFLDYL